jgi:hypothetical protein
MANTIAKSSTVQPKVPRFNRPALSVISLFFFIFLFFSHQQTDGRRKTVRWIFPGDVCIGKENSSVLDFSRG